MQPETTHLRRTLTLAGLILLLAATTVTAGGRREQRDTAAPDTSTRIEMGTEQTGAEENTDGASDSFTGDAGDVGDETLPAWILGRHPLDDQLEPTISGNIERGYVPVGLDMKTGDVTVLYLLTDEIEFTRWTIQKIEDAREINATITAWLQDGWMPLDISLIPGGIAALLVETDHEIDSWRIEVVPATTEALETAYGEYQASGYIPYGLASDPEKSQVWILFLRAEGQFEVPSVLIDAYTDDSVVTGVNERYAAGALPWAMTRLPGSFLVQYLQR